MPYLYTSSRVYKREGNPDDQQEVSSLNFQTEVEARQHAINEIRDAFKTRDQETTESFQLEITLYTGALRS